MDPDEITAHLLRRAQWSASRSSRPGGQHRDKAATRAELTLDADSPEDLDPDVAARLVRALGLEAGPVRIAVQDEALAGTQPGARGRAAVRPRGRGVGAAATAAPPDTPESRCPPRAPRSQDAPRCAQAAAPLATG